MMRAAEEAAFTSGVELEALMDRAGAGIAAAVRNFFPRPGQATVFVGKGHNGGDALVAATRLKEAGWKIDLRIFFPEPDLAELTRKKLQDLRGVQGGNDPSIPTDALVGEQRPLRHTIILDGLLGIGDKH